MPPEYAEEPSLRAARPPSAFVGLAGLLADPACEDGHERAGALLALPVLERWVGALEWEAELIDAMPAEEQSAARASHEHRVRALLSLVSRLSRRRGL